MKLYEISVLDTKNNSIQLETYKDKVLLIVNTATHCGFTPQYEGLQELYDKYQDQGFEILDFPCNQFANQAPEDIDGINSFCTLNYKTTFPRFAKIDVNGDQEAPLYTFLKAEKKGFPTSDIKWNFTKFLIDKSGNVVKRYASTDTPKKIEKDITELLK